MAETESQQVRHEARVDAAFFVLIALGLLLALGFLSLLEGWELRGDVVGGSIWFILCIPELVLLGGLFYNSRHDVRAARHGLEGTFVLVVVGNAAGLAIVVASLLTQSTIHGGQLLATATVVWLVNVIVFGLWFWTLDGGGPVHRALHPTELRDFQFPQDENPQLAAGGWYPRLEDYTYVAFTNAIAFSPTDAMPLTRWAKWLMAIESALSVIAILLVAARAVNILGA
jgi:hypothetical protein